MIGVIFGRLTVLRRDLGRPSGKGKKVYWVCKCECGNTTTVRSDHLTGGKIVSCNCRRLETGHENATHGMSKTKVYAVWCQMINRCHDPMNPRYETYGKRGIRVCPRWRYSFENFFADMGDQPYKGASIDRIDNDKDYEADNCEWIPRNTQTQKQTTTRWLILDGERICFSEAARRMKISRDHLRRLLDEKGMTIEQAQVYWREHHG